MQGNREVVPQNIRRSMPCISFRASNGTHNGHKHFQGIVVTFPSDCKFVACVMNLYFLICVFKTSMLKGGLASKKVVSATKGKGQ
jgi:hypothetical protein